MAGLSVGVNDAAVALSDGDHCWFGIRPEDTHVSDSDWAIPATIYAVEPLGGETVVDLHVADRVVKAIAPPTVRFKTDESVRVTFDPRRIHLFNAEGDVLVSAAGSAAFDVALKEA